MANNYTNLSWLSEILKIIIPAGLAYWFGRKQYLIQRDHEQITKRYLEKGIDIIIEDIEHALSVFRENFAHSLRIVRIFREKQATGVNISPEDYSPDKFIRYKQEYFYTSPFYKLKLLIGKEGKIFYDETQFLFAFVEKATNFFEYDLCTTLKVFVEENKININAKTLCEELMKKIKEYSDESQKYYSLIGELQKITWIIETTPLRYKDLRKIKDRQDIKSCIERLKNISGNEKTHNKAIQRT